VARIAPFEAFTKRYERWFTRHETAYLSELAALRGLIPDPGFALEVGVGTGRFAAPLGVAVGIDPSLRMLGRARDRGIAAVCGIAEALPFRDAVFDHVLIVCTICFVDDPRAMFREAGRVLKPDGAVVLGDIDRTSPLGRRYVVHRNESVFYREARFFSAGEVGELLAQAGFRQPVWRQTLTGPLAETTEIEPSLPGWGKGAFVALRAMKQGT
jgi:ubiquinone/menaquinone biosynthesis C-methylase UbiE